MYLLVQFVEENALGVAMESWLDDEAADGDGLHTIAYPPSKILRRLLIKKTEPSPTWESFKCKILYRNGKQTLKYLFFSFKRYNICVF